MIFAYLGTVTQIMGFDSRYYVPYTPLIIVPALLDARSLAYLGPKRREPALGPVTLSATAALLTAAMLLFFLRFFLTSGPGESFAVSNMVTTSSTTRPS